MNKPLILLSFFLSFFLSESIFCQKIIECGTIKHNERIIDPNDNVFYDRFSNRYSETYFKNLKRNTLTCDETSLGYFELNFSSDVTPAMQDVVCEVFSYLKDVIPQRSESTSCGYPIEQEKVKIDIFADITDPTIGGTGTPLYSDPLDWNCLEVVLSRPYIKINGGYPDPNNVASAPDGLLHLNPSMNWNYDTSLSPVPAGVTDLYAVVLHEALHILGYASRVNITENPTQPEAYTLWDQQLHYANQYDPNGSTVMQGAVLQSDPNANCWSHTTTHSNFLNNVFGSCSAAFTPDVVLGNTGIAPASGGNITTNQDDLRNMLSHLKNDCNGQNGIAYVMHPGIDITIPYTPVREITQPELEILCELGYQVSTSGYSCDGCYVIAHYDHFPNYGPEDCCRPFFHACIDAVITIDPSELICNDISNQDNELEVINLRSRGNPNFSPLSIQYVNNVYEITTTELGFFQLQYTLRGCDGKSHNMQVNIIFDQCIECDDDYCENLFCVDDFEDLIVESAQNLGLPFVYENGINNSPDIKVFDGNNYLFIADVNLAEEAIALELKESIEPNCNIELSVDAVVHHIFENEGAINIYGSEFPPCHPLDVNINYGCVPTDCGTYIYDPVCIGTIDVTNVFIFDANYNLTDLNLETYNFQWFNNQSIPINYIVFKPEKNIALDNINLTKTCIDPDFKYEIDCETLTVTFNVLEQNPLHTHHWDFGDGTTSTDINPIHQYPDAATYTVTHTVTDECGNTAESIQEVDLSDCGTSELCNCPTGTSYDAGEGTTADNLGMPLTISDQCISISGRLILDDVYTWSNVEVRMLPGAEIVIQGFGDRLNIYNQSVLFGCETMWRGIVLGPNKAKLDVQDSEIRDAQFAITASAGCRVNLLNSTFNANNVGIYTAPSAASQFFKPDNNIPWDNNTFQCTYPLLPAYGPEQFPVPGTTSLAGMWFNDAKSLINIFESGFTNYIEGSLFGVIVERGVNLEFTALEIKNLVATDNFTGIGFWIKDSEIMEIVETQIGNIPLDLATESIRIGVLGIDTELEFHENVLATNTIGIELINGLNKGVNIYDNPSISSVSGIQIVNHNNDTETIEVEENIAMDVLYGVTLVSVNSEVLIEDNIINVDADAWPGNDGRGVEIGFSQGEISVIENTMNFSSSIVQPGGRGIGVFNSQNCLVVDNIVNGPMSGSPMMNFGIRVGSATNNAYCCNTVGGSIIGVEFAGLCNATSFYNTIFNDHFFGLRLVNAQIDPQGNTGNNWAGASTLVDAKFEGNIADIPLSLFTTDPNLVPNGHTKISVPNGAQPSDWFLFQGTDASCSNNCGLENPWLLQDDPNYRLSAGDVNAAKDLISNDPITKGLKWEARQNLFDKLNQHPNLIDLDPSVSAFYRSALNNSISELYTIRQELTSISQTGISNSNYWKLKNAVHDISSQIDALQVLWETAAPSKKSTIESQIEGLIESQGKIFDDLKKLESQLMADRILAIDALVQENKALVLTEVYELNEQSITDLYLNTLAKGIYTFTVDQKALIDGIAAQCPFIGGTSVYTARAIQNLYAPKEYDDEAICAAAKTRSEVFNDLQERPSLVNLYPNPAKDVLNIQFSQTLEDNSHFNVYDLTGKQMLNQSLAEGLDIYHLKTSSLSAGIYYFQIVDQRGGIMSIGKFVIIK